MLKYGESTQRIRESYLSIRVLGSTSISKNLNKSSYITNSLLLLLSVKNSRTINCLQCLMYLRHNRSILRIIYRRHVSVEVEVITLCQRTFFDRSVLDVKGHRCGKTTYEYWPKMVTYTCPYNNYRSPDFTNTFTFSTRFDRKRRVSLRSPSTLLINLCGS